MTQGSPLGSLFRSVFLLTALGAFALTGNVSAEPAGMRRYLDAGRAVTVERVASPQLDERGRLLTDVRLTYSDGRVFEAAVDSTAIVELEPGGELSIEARGGRLVRELMPSLGLWLVEDATGGDGVDLSSRLTDEAAPAPSVRSATPNLYLKRRATGDYTPNDPRFPGQWYFQNLGMEEAWGLTRGDAATTIVVIDTGCDLTHPDLVAKMGDGLDVVDDDDDASFDPAYPGAAHGTSCAGIIAASTDNGEGIAGACPECGLHCVRLISDAAVPTSADVAAFQFVLDVDADVVSNSWGYTQPIPVPGPLAAAIKNVADNGRGGKGAVVLFAAGNDDREINDDELQSAYGVINVGAINNFDESTPFTNFGASLDLVAPTGTLTTDISGPAGEDPSDYTSLFGGTSSACPVAAGVAALLVAAAPDKTGMEIGAIMIATTRKAPYATPDAMGHDPVYGYGILDPPTALKNAMGIETGAGGGAAGGAGQGGDGGGSATDDPEEGCGCRLAPQSNGSMAPLALLVAAAFARRGRRLSSG